MSIIQFLRIFWARRNLILAATVACLIGGIIVGTVLPPRWSAHSRVLLDLLKPDPVTGLPVSGNASRYYVQTQTAMVTDPNVVGKVADDLGWVSDPRLIAQYDARPKNNVQDFRTWIASKIIPDINATLIQGTDILDIGYTSNNPRNAMRIADAIRKAYIDSSLSMEREDAARNADWYLQQARDAKVAADNAVNQKVAFERATGVVLQDNKLSVDEARLQSLAGQGAVATATPGTVAQQTLPAAMALAQVDAQIAADSKILGPNHPELIALKSRRAALAAQEAQEQAGLNSATQAAQATRAGVGALAGAVSAQKAKVLAEGSADERLRQLQAEVDIRTDQYNKAMAKSAELRQASGVSDSVLTPLGVAQTTGAPDFPNWFLIIPGSLGLGIALGVLVAFLAELFGRRVRGPEDLSSGLDAPLLASIARAENDNVHGRTLAGTAKTKWPRRRRTAPA